MSKLKKLLSVMLLVISMNVHSGGIPVFDGAAEAQWFLQVAAMAEQLTELQNQYAKAKQQYNSLTGSRGLGRIFHNPLFRNYLPENWKTVYDSVKTGGYAGLTGSALDIFTSNNIFDFCGHLVEASQNRIHCEARAVKPSQDKGFALDAFELAKQRLEQIEELMTAIDATDDPKSIAEIQARISAEQAMLQNEATKLELYKMVAAAESQIQQQIQQQLQAEIWAARKGFVIEPMTFEE